MLLMKWGWAAVHLLGRASLGTAGPVALVEDVAILTVVIVFVVVPSVRRLPLPVIVFPPCFDGTFNGSLLK